MGKAVDNVVQFADYCEPPTKSKYEQYPLPFFAAERRSAWAVSPTGNYSDDCETGKRCAIEFLKSCDGTVGWSMLLTGIVGDMIGAGPTGTWPDGKARINGLIVGFMNTIGSALVAGRYRGWATPRLPGA